MIGHNLCDNENGGRPPLVSQNEDDIEETAACIYERIRTFQAQMKEDFDALSAHAYERFFKSDCCVREDMELKEGAQVMLVWNLDLEDKLANGSRGVVSGFVSAPAYRYLLEEELKKRVPPRGTEKGHKKEGIPTGGEMEKESGDSQEKPSESIPPMGNACRDGSSESISTDQERQELRCLESLLSIEPSLVEEIGKVLSGTCSDDIQKQLACMEKFQEGSLTVKEFPLVKFCEGQVRVIIPRPFQKEFKGCGRATRWQIPLMLAWAVTIHKSQGMTIDWLRVNLAGCFSCGQAYVACSRGRSVDSMYVENFKVNEIKTSKVVKQFYESLHDKTPKSLPTWVDSLENFRQTSEAQVRLKEIMERQYKHERCKLCHGTCHVRQVKKDGPNKGRWFLGCDAMYREGHTWRFLEVPSM